MLLMIDNYDSFTYNLVQYLSELGAEVKVVRNDALSLDDIEALTPERIVISPGPGHPGEAGLSKAILERFGPRIPTLGVCLGHQCMGEVFGAQVVRAPFVMHGKTSMIQHDGQGLFAGLPNPFQATRYHSLVVEREGLPEALEVTAWTDDGLIMGMRHRAWPWLVGVQFHPESILTTSGHDMLRNFLGMRAPQLVR